jgi:hypothetical protein
MISRVLFLRKRGHTLYLDSLKDVRTEISMLICKSLGNCNFKENHRLKRLSEVIAVEHGTKSDSLTRLDVTKKSILESLS